MGKKTEAGSRTAMHRYCLLLYTEQIQGNWEGGIFHSCSITYDLDHRIMYPCLCISVSVDLCFMCCWEGKTVAVSCYVYFR